METKEQTFLFPGETLEEVFYDREIRFEVLERPKTIWCGVLGYASNLKDEPDVERLLEKYQSLASVQMRKRLNWNIMEAHPVTRTVRWKRKHRNHCHNRAEEIGPHAVPAAHIQNAGLLLSALSGNYLYLYIKYLCHLYDRINMPPRSGGKMMRWAALTPAINKFPCPAAEAGSHIGIAK